MLVRRTPTRDVQRSERLFTQPRASSCKNFRRVTEKDWTGKVFGDAQGFLATLDRFVVAAAPLNRRRSGRKKSPPGPFQARRGVWTPTAAIKVSKLTRFNTRFKLYTSVIRLHSQRTFASP